MLKVQFRGNEVSVSWKTLTVDSSSQETALKDLESLVAKFYPEDLSKFKSEVKVHLVPPAQPAKYDPIIKEEEK